MKSNLEKDGLRTYEGHHYEIVVPEGALEDLKNEVNSLLEEDIRLKLKVNKLLKTEKTFDRSLGILYDYLKDQRRCSQCDHHLLSCPKEKYAGYQLDIYYDEINDSIQCNWNPCAHLLQVQETLSRIKPCDFGRKKLYLDAMKLVSCITTGNNAKKMKDVTYVISKAQKDAKNSILEKGFALYSTTDVSLVSSSLHAIALYYATNGKKVAMIDSKSFFENLKSFRNDEKDAALKDLQRAKKADVLIFENLDQMGYANNSLLNDYIIPLLDVREEKEKRNYCSISSPEKMNHIIYGRDLVAKDEVNQRIAKLFDLYAIKVIDLR